MMKTSSKQLFLLIAVVSLCSLLVAATDPDPVLDFCVSVNETEAKVFVNGRICKDPTTVKTDDFYFAGALNVAHEIVSPLGIALTPVFEPQLPGLNTQGLSMTRVDYLPHGLNPPHTHPRATEVITVLEGKLYAGFMTANPVDPNRLFARILYPGDVFVFPRGLMHF
ncbi:germin-like protein 6 [Perilla frutescens var. frutescens]|nr:germin-like protein 6 [Perilla frutescens var. frutescens]